MVAPTQSPVSATVRQRVPVSRRARRRRRARLRGRRRLVRRFGPTWWAIRLGLLALLGVAAYLAVTAVLVRADVAKLQVTLRTMQDSLQAGRLDEARAAAVAAGPTAAHAHRLTAGPVWSVAADIPVVGAPLASVRGTTAAVDALTNHVLPTVTAAAGSLGPAALRPNGATVDVARLQALAPSLHEASMRADAVQRSMASVPEHTWLPVVDDARAQFGTSLSRLTGLLRGADQAAAIAPRLLGVDGTRRYFVAFQNEAEARGTGGLPGAFAIMSATRGTVTFDRFESDSLLGSQQPDGTVPTGLDFGPAYAAAWSGSDPTSLYVNSNLSAHFPYAAQTWVAMWQKVTGEHLDGAIALDPTALSYLLGATGPATLADGTTVSAEDVVDLTQRDAYARFGDDPAGTAARKAWLVSVTEAAERRLLTDGAPPTAVVKALARGVGERRLLVWSSDPVLQQALERTPAAGVVPDTAAPYAGIVVNDVTAGKLDYYLGRRVDYLRTGCGASRDVQTTVTFTNSAPASGLPAIVTQRADADRSDTAPGDTRVLLDYVATQGARLAGVTVNGVPGTASRQTEQGHPVFRLEVEIPRGRTVAVTLHLTEPAGTGERPTVMVPPAVGDTPVGVVDQSCSS